MYTFRNPNQAHELPHEDAQADTQRDVEAQDWESPDFIEIEEIEAEAEEVEEEAYEPVEDSIQLYLHEIGQVALLTAEEERSLAIQIAQGKVAQGRIANKDYSDGRERARLEFALAQSNEARRKLIQANLRLVVSIAKKYIGSPMAFMDLVQEGNIGLMRAVEKFDYTKGNRFSTYATWWIRQAVTRSIAEQSRTIRLPVHLSESLVHLRRAIYQLEQQLEREPTPQEIAQTMGMSLRKVKRLLQASIQPISLEQPLTNENEGRVGETVADETMEAPIEIAAQKMLNIEIHSILNGLPERERKILQLRYGLLDGNRRTLEEVGVTFGITRERTRQIEADALRRLRHPSIGQRLYGYLE